MWEILKICIILIVSLCERFFNNHADLGTTTESLQPLRYHTSVLCCCGTSTGEKLFHCSVCEKTLGDPSSLKIHIRIHTGEKPFSCSFCEKSENHIRTHTGEMPFSCSSCEKFFTVSSSLRNHSRFHYRENPTVIPVHSDGLLLSRNCSAVKYD